MKGYIGATIQKPPPGSTEYTTIFRFDTVDNLRRFEESELRHSIPKVKQDWSKELSITLNRVTDHGPYGAYCESTMIILLGFFVSLPSSLCKNKKKKEKPWNILGK